MCQAMISKLEASTGRQTRMDVNAQIESLYKTVRMIESNPSLDIDTEVGQFCQEIIKSLGHNLTNSQKLSIDDIWSIALAIKYRRTMEISFLHEAIAIRLQLTQFFKNQKADQNYAYSLKNLINLMQEEVKTFVDKEKILDLLKITKGHYCSILSTEFCKNDLIFRANTLNELGLTHQLSFRVDDDITSLLAAIDAFRSSMDYMVAAKAAVNAGAPRFNLASALRMRSDCTGGDPDLVAKSIELFRENMVVQSAMDEPLRHLLNVNGLARALLSLGEMVGDLNFVAEAVGHLRRCSNFCESEGLDEVRARSDANLIRALYMQRKIFSTGPTWEELVSNARDLYAGIDEKTFAEIHALAGDNFVTVLLDGAYGTSNETLFSEAIQVGWHAISKYDALGLTDKASKIEAKVRMMEAISGY